VISREAWLESKEVADAINAERTRKRTSRSLNPWRRDVSPMYYAAAAGRPIGRRSGGTDPDDTDST
jgi:hypothetical protein